ncbi:hypothetical protein LIX60_24880 [Streptomyces sp. S07_1.15]|uniref:hypothetical protein n=1 Tax=Streptomyces sp. S07_1.15 TaxID=2873925 RepID=UPI001D15D022|nr:hypothetical protein [Streptomyces sp. S07_1.15]MCC3654642.1 hypothetical protein [Streptomyces sp. S07_1.15]
MRAPAGPAGPAVVVRTDAGKPVAPVPAAEWPAGDSLVVDLGGAASAALAQCADVLWSTGEEARARSLLRTYPGCLVVMLRTPAEECVAFFRSGARVAAAAGGDRAGDAGDRQVLGAALHAWYVAALPLEDLDSALLVRAERVYRFRLLGPPGCRLCKRAASRRAS